MLRHNSGHSGISNSQPWSRFVLGALGLVIICSIAFASLILPGALTSRAIQAPSMSIDMVPTSNTYNDTTNTMSVGAIDNCLTSLTGNNSTHAHQAHLVVQDVEDLVGWQARLNYLGDQMRPNFV